jgi:hypothetical protein
MPATDSKLLAWLKALIAYLLLKCAEWNVPQKEVNALNLLITEFENALAVGENPATRTKVTVQEKNSIRKAVKSKTRFILKTFVTCNPAVTDVKNG